MNLGQRWWVDRNQTAETLCRLSTNLKVAFRFRQQRIKVETTIRGFAGLIVGLLVFILCIFSAYFVYHEVTEFRVHHV